MKKPIEWSKYKEEIISLSKEGKSSSQIVSALKKKHGDIFPGNADRRVRRVLSKNVHRTNTNAKILIYDLETHPLKCLAWSKYTEYINDDFLIHGWGLLSWSAKWLFEDKVFSDKLTKEELNNLTQNDIVSDERITKSLWELFDEADVIIAHNNNKFDEKRANTKFLYYGLKRPSPYKSVDTLKSFREKFAADSNKLDYLAKKFFHIEGKLKTEVGLWRKVMDNDYEALKYMEQYNIQDIHVLEAVYLEMRGWIVNHPNTAMQAVSDNNCCPVCSSAEREDCKTPYRTHVNEFDAFRCLNCNHIYRSRTSNTPLKDNKGLKLSTPK